MPPQDKFTPHQVAEKPVSEAIPRKLKLTLQLFAAISLGLSSLVLMGKLGNFIVSDFSTLMEAYLGSGEYASSALSTVAEFRLLTEHL